MNPKDSPTASERAAFDQWLRDLAGPTGDQPGYPAMSPPPHFDQREWAWYGFKHGAEYARSRLAAATPVVPPSGWQPIETAPKDGSWLLLFGDTSRTNAMQMVCRWDGEAWESSDDGYRAYINPTHWRAASPSPRTPEQPEQPSVHPVERSGTQSVAATDASADARDAARYRWLRHGDNDDIVIRFDPFADYSFLLRSDELDAAIDAAITKEKQA